jgi:hypothetical protein
MDIIDVIGDLLDAAYGILKQSSFEETDDDGICLLVNESLGDCFSFCLKKNDTEYLWTRKQRSKKNDISKVVNPIDQLKYITQKLLPDISTQNGVTRLNEAKELFIYARQHMDLDKEAVSDSIQLDGTEYTIEIFTGGKSALYKWDQLPLQWASLASLLHMLLDLNKKLA